MKRSASNDCIISRNVGMGASVGALATTSKRSVSSHFGPPDIILVGNTEREYNEVFQCVPRNVNSATRRYSPLSRFLRRMDRLA